MKYLIQRLHDNKQSTIGILYLRTEEKLALEAFTIEDEARDIKVQGETRIPAGTYILAIQNTETPLTKKYQSKYPWFKRHIEITNVPGFKGVYIHIGNSDIDTAGCVLLGDAVDNNAVSPGTITNSTIAFKRFYDTVYDALLSGKNIQLEIRNEEFLK